MAGNGARNHRKKDARILKNRNQGSTHLLRLPERKIRGQMKKKIRILLLKQQEHSRRDVNLPHLVMDSMKHSQSWWPRSVSSFLTRKMCWDGVVLVLLYQESIKVLIKIKGILTRKCILICSTVYVILRIIFDLFLLQVNPLLPKQFKQRLRLKLTRYEGRKMPWTFSRTGTWLE